MWYVYCGVVCEYVCGMLCCGVYLGGWMLYMVWWVWGVPVCLSVCSVWYVVLHAVWFGRCVLWCAVVCYVH